VLALLHPGGRGWRGQDVNHLHSTPALLPQHPYPGAFVRDREPAVLRAVDQCAAERGEAALGGVQGGAQFEGPDAGGVVGLGPIADVDPFFARDAQDEPLGGRLCGEQGVL
jgi:hypothetical protein